VISFTNATFLVKFSGDTSYLLFKETGDDTGLKAAKLTTNGLGIEKSQKVANFSENIQTFWHFKHRSKDFIIFSEFVGSGLKVAKSDDGVLGPYRVGRHILIGNFLREDYQHPSVLEEDGNYHLIFGSAITQDVFLVSLNWEAGWPYAVKFA